MNGNSKAGGILILISGVLGIIWGILIFINLQYAYLWEFVLVGGIIELILGIFTVVAGSFAVKQNLWGLALAGALAGIFTFFPTAVAAIILISLGRKEFKQTAVSTI